MNLSAELETLGEDFQIGFLFLMFPELKMEARQNKTFTVKVRVSLSQRIIESFTLKIFEIKSNC